MAGGMTTKEKDTIEISSRNIDDIDGRSLRKTAKTHPLSTKVQNDTFRKIKLIALEENITMSEVIERAIHNYAEALLKVE